MNFLNYRRSYLSSCTTDELKERLNTIFNEKLLFGLMRNAGELTDSTFKIKGLRSAPSRWSFFPVVLGKFEEGKQGTKVDLTITPGLFCYLMEGFALLLILLLVVNPSTTINGEPSTLSDRLIFGSIFILLWTFFLGIFTTVAVNVTKYRTESSLGLTIINK